MKKISRVKKLEAENKKLKQALRRAKARRRERREVADRLERLEKAEWRRSFIQMQKDLGATCIIG